MKIVIIYTSGKGYVEGFVKDLAPQLKQEVSLVNLKKEKVPDLKSFDIVFAAAGIKASQLPKKMIRFLETNIEILKTKKVRFLLSSLEDKDDKLKAYMASNCSEQLLGVLNGYIWIGGKIDLSQYNIFLRSLLKKIIKSDENVYASNPKAVPQILEVLKQP